MDDGAGRNAVASLVRRPRAGLRSGGGLPAQSVSADGRIPFRLTIGVIGHRSLPESEGLRRAVRSAIDRAISESGYPTSGLPSTRLTLTVVSALAEGAGRLVAQEILDRPGSRLVCVLPVATENIEVYLADFASQDSREEFRRLYDLAWRRIHPSPGDVPRGTTQPERDAGYLWAGRAVLRNSDVLIALWDGQPARGAGGTGDLIRRMRERDKMLSRSGDLSGSHRGPVRRALGRWAAREVPPPEAEPLFAAAGPLRILVSTTGDHEIVVDDRPPWEAGADAVRERLAGELRGLDALNRVQDAAADRQDPAEKIASDLAPAEYRDWPRLNGLLEWITPSLTHADHAAIAAQRSFLRSSYALFLCTASATIIAATQAIFFPRLWELALAEATLLVASVIVVATGARSRNHERWTVYRFLAERLRAAYYLSAVGIIPPIEFDIGGAGEDAARNGWIRRAVTEVLAQREPDRGEPPEPLETLSALIRIHWLGGQVSYFKSARRKLTRKHNIIRSSLYAVFAATIAAALLHSLGVWPLHSTAARVLLICAIGLPAVAGTLSNVRSLREFGRHANRYARMADALRRYMDRFDRESSINDLRRLAEAVEDLLSAENRGWLGMVSARGLEIHG